MIRPDSPIQRHSTRLAEAGNALTRLEKDLSKKQQEIEQTNNVEKMNESSSSEAEVSQALELTTQASVELQTQIKNDSPLPSCDDYSTGSSQNAFDCTKDAIEHDLMGEYKRLFSTYDRQLEPVIGKEEKANLNALK